MEARLTAIDRGQVLQYQGFKGDVLPPALEHIQDGAYLNTILTEHKAIFDAFETRNPAAGRKAMQYHMEQSKLRRMSKYF